MKKEILSKINSDQLNVIKKAKIIERPYSLNYDKNYILLGIRKSGKSNILYNKVLNLIESGVSWSQIVYIDFDDVRLWGFTEEDFASLLELEDKAQGKQVYFFLDEIQNFKGWETFIKELSDSGRRVFIACSNLPSSITEEAKETLKTSFEVRYITPYSFREYLSIKDILPLDKKDWRDELPIIKKEVGKYLKEGGFPETIFIDNKRDYLSIVFRKLILGDIVLKNDIRHTSSLRSLIKSLTECVHKELSFNEIHRILRGVNINLSTESIIDYVRFLEGSFVIFPVFNFYSTFGKKERCPRYFFYDNAILSLFLYDRAALLENIVALTLYKKFRNGLFFLKSTREGIDYHFYVPLHETVIQIIPYSRVEKCLIEDKIKIIKRLRKRKNFRINKFLILNTADETERYLEDGLEVEIIPIHTFLLRN